MTLHLRDFDYVLPPERIAQHPLAQRDRSRLMVLRRSGGGVDHRQFANLPDLLGEGDVLVLNDTRVIPAKFSCRRKTGAKLEGLFLRETDEGLWEVLLKNAGRCRPGELLPMSRADGVELELRENLGQGRWRLAAQPPGRAVEILDQAGAPPLPPYIRREQADEQGGDRTSYQTVYADRPGAVAAPTAGLHFTQPLLAEIAARGVETAHVTLHVGLGTFSPVKSDELAAHDMHAEWYEMSAETADRLNAARSAGRRIVAVGTTSVRVLETVAAVARQDGEDGRFHAAAGWTDVFLYPPADFLATDALITNFHLPKSTLLMLVAAFCSPGATAGLQTILDAYAEAIRREYRFYSYGDAMLIE
jgi:S-adenosylmethionine:tRNA ribosyltransferase-isomerase